MRIAIRCGVIVTIAFLTLAGTAWADERQEPDSCKDVLRNSESTLRDHYNGLLKAEIFYPSGFGPPGNENPEENGNLAAIVSSPCSKTLLLKLVNEATSAGKLWALKGLRKKDEKLFRTVSAQVVREHGLDKVTIMNGCLVDDSTMRDEVASLGSTKKNSAGSQPRAMPQVRVGDTIVTGALSKEVIHRIIRQHVNELKFCYEQQLNASPHLNGEVNMKFEIAPTGSVKSATIADTELHNTMLEQCVARAIRRWVFPVPDGGQAVFVSNSFSFILAAAENEGTNARNDAGCVRRALPYNFVTKHGFKVRVESEGSAKVYDIRTGDEKFLYALPIQNQLDAVHIDATGRIAVVLEARDAPNKYSVGLEFFLEGKLIKSYRIVDLVKDQSKLGPWKCGYVWIPGNSANPVGLSLDGTQMSVVTVDNRHYVFSTQDGRIIRERMDHIPRYFELRNVQRLIRSQLKCE